MVTENGIVPVRGGQTCVLDEGQIEQLHSATIEVLNEVGIRMLHDEALEIMGAHGCVVDFR